MSGTGEFTRKTVQIIALPQTQMSWTPQLPFQRSLMLLFVKEGHLFEKYVLSGFVQLNCKAIVSPPCLYNVNET